jgi:hypothetical protein
MDDLTSLDHGSNISGISLLLNVEKISNEIDVDDMEKKVKSMYIENIAEEEDPEEDADAGDVLKEYEEAMEEIETVIGDDIEEEEEEEEEDAKSVYNPASYQGPDSLYIQKTREEMLQTNISKALETVPKMNIDMDQEIEEERKSYLLEQIESLKDDLDELGIPIDRIPYVSYDSPLKQIDEVHKRLMFKYNKLKYNSIAEEALVAGASVLEMIFNGKHEYFGCRPDITGYSDVVKSKLKRIRFETSTAVNRFVTNNNIGGASMVMMELLPSLITQSQRRRLQTADTINANIGKESIRSHISDLNSMIQ